MANTPSSPKPVKAKPLFEKKKWILIVGALFIVTIIFWPSGSSDGKSSGTPGTEKPKPVEQKVTVIKKVQLDPEKWSECISLAELKPPEVSDDARFRFQINAPKLYEIRDWTGKTLFARRDEEQAKEWLGDISSSTFRLLGEGEAVIRIEYIFSK